MLCPRGETGSYYAAPAGLLITYTGAGEKIYPRYTVSLAVSLRIPETSAAIVNTGLSECVGGQSNEHQ